MDLNEFHEKGFDMIDYIVNYAESLSQRCVTPTVSSGYLLSALPSTPPKTGESYEKIMEDVEKYILPGLTHWNHPGFNAFFPSCSSFSSILGSMPGDLLSNVGFNWRMSPSASELEIIMLDWYGKMIGLPDCFLRNGAQDNRGAGILFRSTCESIFISMVTARQTILRKLSHHNPSISSAALLLSLVAYCSTESHCSIEKIALAALVNVRVLETDEKLRLRGETLAKAIKEDKKIGLIPFFVIINLGTISCGSCDPINEIGPVCEEHEVWLHVDAAYAGNAMVCPEYRYLGDGLKYASSFHVNPSNWFFVHTDCSLLYVKDRFILNDAVISDRTILGYTFTEKDWGYPSRRGIESLKVFFVLKTYGVEKLQEIVRNHISLAKVFEDNVRKNERFEIINRNFGLVCFRLKDSDEMNRDLRLSINSSGKLYLTPSRIHGKYVIRFMICSERANESTIKNAWEIICEHAANLKNKGPRELTATASSEIFEEYYKFGLP